ncbi:MAG: alpha-ketoglutarate-dependent dioxygenase AlkB [Pseudomonadota bacterium]
MQFTNQATKEKQELYLEERSLIKLAGPARKEWLHGIPARKSDIVNGLKIARKRRISITFRNVILD